MDNLFLHVINMSITSCYVILFVIIARLLLKKAPKVFSYALWSVVLFRLICPFSFESIFSLIPINTQAVPHNIIHSQTPQIHSGITAIDTAVNNSLPAPALSENVIPMQLWVTIGKFVWLFGIAALLIYGIFTIVRLSRKLRNAEPFIDNIYEMNGIKTPFVMGMIKPKIYLPAGLSDNEKSYIIKHEQTHIKRFDHIIKPFSFLVLCVHWFNPLVWAAFFLMSEDMELSCDESVIKQMGNNIKKDYSTSLLSLSVGRHVIGRYPLAFGENNTKGRIVNILNYKKPAFWVIIAAVIAVAAICIGLISNPQKERLTVEDYANQYVDEAIKNCENENKNKELQLPDDFPSYKIVDSKITKFEKIASFDNMLSYPVELWRLEYRLKPDDINKVIFAGGREESDGWFYGSSMGYPILVFSYKHSYPEYLGCTWDDTTSDFRTAAGQETVLRIFLEDKGLLPNETYSGNHVIVNFTDSTGETTKLLLSQPVVQGDLGIWCVERWMDGHGNIYHGSEFHDIPETDMLLIDYYKKLQKQCDKGQNSHLLDPVNVAIDYINVDLRHYYITQDDIEVEYSAAAKDFAKLPESHFIGYISDFETFDKVQNRSSFHLDTIELLTKYDTEKLAELNIDPNNLPNGYYIHNPDNYPKYCQVTDKTKYNIINPKKKNAYKSVSMEEFMKYLEQRKDNAPLFKVIKKGLYIESITEQNLQ